MGNPLFGTPADKAKSPSPSSSLATKPAATPNTRYRSYRTPPTTTTSHLSSPPYHYPTPDRHIPSTATFSHATGNQIRTSLAYTVHAAQPHATPHLRSRLRRLAEAHAQMMAQPNPLTELQMYEEQCPEGATSRLSSLNALLRSAQGTTSNNNTNGNNHSSTNGNNHSSTNANGNGAGTTSPEGEAASAGGDGRGSRRTTFTGSITANGAGANTGAGVTRPKTEAELEADRRYEEQIEEQYARMEGGA